NWATTVWHLDEDGDTWQPGDITSNKVRAGGATGNVVLAAPASGAPACDIMFNNSVTFELDEAGNNLYFKVQYSTGVGKSGSIAVA
ncbi:hypothetical protein KA005_09690, partial [bacterium]|nr:hypothetical protein [bacterium]